MMQIKNFISVDWGTSNFRMRLIDGVSLDIIDEIESSMGVKVLYDEWLQNGGERKTYFLRYLKSQFVFFKTQIDPALKIVISGMATSSIGLLELPYTELPFNINGKNLYSEVINSNVIANPIVLISGVKSNMDVIRGEEVQIVGLAAEGELNRSAIYVLPGTHSKHITVKSGFVTDFKTYMTGEVFEMISQNSILKDAVEFGSVSAMGITAFREGVLHLNKKTSLLNSIFKVRTNMLFEKRTKVENYYFLSGLLIGEELKILTTLDYDAIQLCAGGTLFELYYEAMKVLNLISKTNIVSKDMVDRSVILGHSKILTQMNKKEFNYE